MITKLTLKNFKSIDSETFDFTKFDLLVGRNNSGKSTILQALAIWQFCVDEFKRSKRTGSKGIQIVLPNFTALPVPEFNLLWKDRTDRHWPLIAGKKMQEYILIGIEIEWKNTNNEIKNFGVELRYHSPQTIYAIPKGGWGNFREHERDELLPNIAYVPPFSGLEPTEKWLDISPIRQQVGKGQPGSVLRNLLLRVCPAPAKGAQGRSAKRIPPVDWKELADTVERWFGIKIHEPKYDSAKDVNISVEYRQNSKNYDIIAGGSGFHQTLTLLAFLYGYRPTTILLDEPDAHLHVNLQREILDYFRKKSNVMNVQFLIATHAEEFVRGVDVSQIVSLLGQKPRRVVAIPGVLRAMSEVTNEEIVRLGADPFILYVEGDSDERILRSWASKCDAQAAIDKVCFRSMGGGSKTEMKAQADEHFRAVKEIIPEAKRLMLFDYDDAQTAFHPQATNQTLHEWKRKNIENYLFVPEAWKRTILKELIVEENNLLAIPLLNAVSTFFQDQNLTLPVGKTWENVTASIFSVLDGKKLLFENDDSLFHSLRNSTPSVLAIREIVALNMDSHEIHSDVKSFYDKLKTLTTGNAATY